MTSIARLACAALFSAAAATALAQGAASPAKKELVQKVLSLQQAGIENVGAEIMNRPLMQLMQASSQALGQIPAEKRQALAQELQAEAKKFADDNLPAFKAAANRNAAATIGASLEEKFSDEELKALIAWLESPVNRKYQAFSAEAPDLLARKVLADVQGQMDPKLKALQQTFTNKLRAAAGEPAAPASAGKPAATKK